MGKITVYNKELRTTHARTRKVLCAQDSEFSGAENLQLGNAGFTFSLFLLLLLLLSVTAQIGVYSPLKFYPSKLITLHTASHGTVLTLPASWEQFAPY